MQTLSALLTWLELIPAAFWGIVVGSFFTLGGVFLTNRANDRRLRAQLDHDRILKSRERELSLRRDIYLTAVEAVAAGLSSTARFANLSIPDDKLVDRYLEKSSAIAKAHVIARENTIKALANLVSEMGATYLRLFVRRYPLVAQKQRIELISNQMNAFSKERDRMLELMKLFNIDGLNDKRRWDVIQDSFKFEQDRITKSLQEHKVMSADLRAKQLEFLKECLAENAKLSGLMVPALVAIREELELPVDEIAYRQIMEENLKKQEESLSHFLRDSDSLELH